jgi:hypothetical protein
MVFHGAFKDLLNVNFHLPEKRRRNGIAVTLISDDGHAALDAMRLENRF